jgi:hypothetical protein
VFAVCVVAIRRQSFSFSGFAGRVDERRVTLCNDASRPHVKVRTLIPIVSVSLAGCFHGHICLTPPYDAPAGFSESYHAAIQRQEALGITTALPSSIVGGGTFVGPPIFAWPTSIKDSEPPMEW